MSEMTGARIRQGFILCYPVNYIAKAGEGEADGGVINEELLYLIGCFVTFVPFYKYWRSWLCVRVNVKKMKRYFQLESEQYQLVTTYQPSHIELQVRDKRSGRMKKGVFYDSTLPEPVRQECQAVGDLYEFLEGKTAQEIMVEEDKLRFKVVHIKKERWYSLQMEEEPMQEMKKQEEMEDVKQKPGVMEAERDQLIMDNESLRTETFQLRKINGELLQLLSQERQKHTVKSLPFQDPQPMFCMEQQPLKQINVSRRSQWINLRVDQPNHYYRVEGNYITKLSDDSSLLTLSPIIQGEKVHFGLKIVGRLLNNWIIFGVIAQEHRNRSYCYFQKKCIAFSGSMGLIFNELETIDLGLIPSQGDCIRVCINSSEQCIEWTLNDRKFIHKMSEKMSHESLIPFLMLARSGDSISLLQE